MLNMIQEEITKGKIVIKLTEFKEGFYIWKNILIVLTKNGEFIVCKVKSDLNEKEIKLLKLDLEKGLRKIKEKIQQEAPITVYNGKVQNKDKVLVYYDDLMIIRTENGVITCNIA